jgi:hypothetical protein
MRGALLALSLITAVVSWGGAKEPLPSSLAAGRYAVKISGFFCATCGRAMVEELKALPAVSEAAFDFDTETVDVTVRLNETLRLSAFRRALSRASKRVNIGSKLDVAAVSYRP